MRLLSKIHENIVYLSTSEEDDPPPRNVPLDW